MDYRESTGIGKKGGSQLQTGATTGTSTTEDEPTVTIDTEEIANRFIVAVIGGVASAAVTRMLFNKKE